MKAYFYSLALLLVSSTTQASILQFDTIGYGGADIVASFQIDTSIINEQTNYRDNGNIVSSFEWNHSGGDILDFTINGLEQNKTLDYVYLDGGNGGTYDYYEMFLRFIFTDDAEFSINYLKKDVQYTADEYNNAPDVAEMVYFDMRSDEAQFSYENSEEIMFGGISSMSINQVEAFVPLPATLNLFLPALVVLFFRRLNFFAKKPKTKV